MNRKTTLLKALMLLVLALTFNAPALAVDGLGISIGSHHTLKDTPCNGMTAYNETNPGLGVRWKSSRYQHLEYEAGFYRNSLANTTLYVIGTWTPLVTSGFEAGLMAGLVTGYCRPLVPSTAFVLNWYPQPLNRALGIQLIGLPPIKHGNESLGGVFGLRVLVNF